MDPHDPELDPGFDPNDHPHRLPPAVAKLRHPDGITVIELGVRGDIILAHEVSSIDVALMTGCGSVPVAGLPTELFALLVSTGYIAGRDALTATDAIARELPIKLLSPGARRACELIAVIENEVERQRSIHDGEVEEHDA
jgi:hypothetical protein